MSVERLIPAQRTRRIAFALYALALFTGTHWPRLQLPDVGDISRVDLILHFVAFFGWTALCIGCAWFGPILSRRNIGRCAVVALCYAAIDEITQALPGVNRQVGLDDFLMNGAGVVSAAALAALASRLAPFRPLVRPGGDSGRS